MDENQIEADIAVIIEGIVYRSIESVWKEYVEDEIIVKTRIYWRDIFFEALYRIYPTCNLEVPSGKEFVNMLDQFARQV